jgi:hypothetical protein
LRFVTGRLPVTPVERGKPVKFVAIPLLGVPRAPPLYKTVPPAPKATELPSVPVNVNVFETVSVLLLAIVNTPLLVVVTVNPFTVVGVMAPRTKVKAGVVVQVAHEAETPLAVTTEILVTVPDPPPDATVA